MVEHFVLGHADEGIWSASHSYQTAESSSPGDPLTRPMVIHKPLGQIERSLEGPSCRFFWAGAPVKPQTHFETGRPVQKPEEDTIQADGACRLIE
jgi:hypothetical protein